MKPITRRMKAIEEAKQERLSKPLPGGPKLSPEAQKFLKALESIQEQNEELRRNPPPPKRMSEAFPGVFKGTNGQ